jgi:hypothetical protein
MVMIIYNRIKQFIKYFKVDKAIVLDKKRIFFIYSGEKDEI